MRKKLEFARTLSSHYFSLLLLDNIIERKLESRLNFFLPENCFKSYIEGSKLKMSHHRSLAKSILSNYLPNFGLGFASVFFAM